jgi:hypothetical protein
MNILWISESFLDDFNDTIVIIYPASESQLHMLDGCTCFCQPSIELYEDGLMITHNRIKQS